MRFRKLFIRRGFTAIELMVVIGVIAVLTAILLPTLARNREKSKRIQCVSNLKQIGTAYRIWPEVSDKYPAQTEFSRGGWQNYLEQTNSGQYCWTNYALMRNELGGSPLILTCPADERQPAPNFGTLRNTNVSYFVGADANENWPLSILGGDRNLARGRTPKEDYGFSKPNGEGNDVWIKTNSAIDPICWSLKMHSHGDTNGAGNILLGDGSVQQLSSANFRTDFQTNAAVASGYNPAEQHQISFRLIFP